ncbi:unnamed protein product [Lactuca virosa]|uniref:Uncharacterized protein n=1 Tax=Lactuca virosa TaxID=75947 RepID=A0AAU9MPI9_9ASTR|nr:unnamed protein product [Lactuca virosa]
MLMFVKQDSVLKVRKQPKHLLRSMAGNMWVGKPCPTLFDPNTNHSNGPQAYSSVVFTIAAAIFGYPLVIG